MPEYEVLSVNILFIRRDNISNKFIFYICAIVGCAKSKTELVIYIKTKNPQKTHPMTTTAARQKIDTKNARHIIKR